MNRTRAILVAIGLLATPLVAQKPAASLGGFRFSTAYENEFNANRVQYGVRSTGEIGRKVGCGSCLTGGFWPKGSGDAYTYNSGAQVTGIIAGAKSASNPWGGDTAGGSFLPSGQLEHGTPFSEMFNSDSAVDPSNWPASARVPRGDATELLYHSTLRGREFAADGNLWFLTWEGDPARNGGRAHPLGVLAEVRLLGWNYPVGNDDLLYVVITYYNISSANAADYASYRPGMREKLLEAGQKFQALNNAKFGITLPVGGYTIAPFLAGFTTDFDVGGAGINSASVNLPNAFAFAWQTNFSQPAAWTFDPRLFGKPFFAGSGFVGMKFLKTATPSPTINLVSASVGGGAFGEPGNTTRLFRYQSGDIRPELGVSCNFGDPLVTHICYIKQDTPADARVFQSAPAVTLSPGGSTTIALAYLHAAPVAIPGYAGGAPNVTPVDVLRLGNAQQLALGSPKVDSIAGYAGYSDANGDGVVQPREMRTVPRSLYGKAQLAQAVFDAKFLLPSAPEPPDFFLIPGSNKVTVVWKPSITETAGDPYFEIAKNAATVPAGGGAPVPNPLYDPNFRKFDLEGYRLYRGRTDQPGALTLIAQYDYKGTSFDDYDGRVGENITCGPEFGFGNCVAFFDPIVPGVPRTKKITHDIVGDLVQVRDGDRTLLSNNAVAVLTADTSGRSYSKGARPLTNSGVPFVYQDSDVRNSSAYFYAVTAFDYNSIQSGPTMMESLRVAKRVVPVVPAGNLLNTASLEQGVYGRKGILTDAEAPTMDPVTGRFSKRAIPADGLSLSLAGFVKELLTSSGEVSLRLDSITAGAQVAPVTQQATHYFTLTSNQGSSVLAVPMLIDLTSGIKVTEASIPGVAAEAASTSLYGGGGGYVIPATYQLRVPGAYYTTIKSRGCLNGAGGFASTSAFGICFYNGPRWFVGDIETENNPNSANTGSFNDASRVTTNFNNVGARPAGVARLHTPSSYNDRPALWRGVEGVLAPFAAAADYRLFWGGGGQIDSVVDLTHDVQVPLGTRVGSSWGILNPTAVLASQSYDARSELTASDVGCVEPLKSNTVVQQLIPCTGGGVALRGSVTPGPIVFDHAFSGVDVDRTAPSGGASGFILYLKGHFFQVELAAGALPLAGAQWTMRDYVGAIAGGNGAAGDGGSYVFTTQSMPRPFTAIGASVKVKYTLINEVTSSNEASLAQVHTVPDPYYIARGLADVPIRFIHLPEKATIRIYSSSGRLIRLLQHDSATREGEAIWDVRTRDNKFVASGVYFYHITAENGASVVGRMTVVRDVR